MRVAVLSSVVLVFGAMAPAHAVSETAEGFSAAMQGCWNRAGVEDASSQMCLDGELEGVLTLIECQNHGDLTECSTQDGRYGFRDEKFWRGFDGLWNNCDVLLDAGTSVTLSNCAWIDPSPSAEPIEDAVYERAIGQ